MNYTALLREAEAYVKKWMQEHPGTKFYYHNLKHTENVVAAAKQIAATYNLSDKEQFIIQIASWFHDVGYYKDIKNHEQEGAAIASTFLKGKGVGEEIITAVRGCILATKMPQNPTSLLEEIMCDADLFHLGTDKFAEQNKLMRKEYEAIHGTEGTKQDWRKATIQFLTAHHYHTAYCKKVLSKAKAANLQKLKKKAEQEDITADSVKKVVQEKGNGENVKEENKKKERPDKGVETMFRIVAGNSQRLSDQADTKAHIMISVNTLIVGGVLGLVFRKVAEYEKIIVPSVMFVIASLVTIIYSILATRPNIRKGTFTETEVAERKVNLLFFGNFYRMGFDEYSKAMLPIMDDKQLLYLSLLRDVYNQGVVLGKKYRMLKIAYTVFMYGLIISVIAFFIATYISLHSEPQNANALLLSH
ncbi:MAG: HD domain-containing protein [Flavisolibacter sp.]|nr:HD domain-containing protein [Flavisolibacter sp.]MBD0376137.1 HD domain-containing protein [Flavisolibacter sp.]